MFFLVEPSDIRPPQQEYPELPSAPFLDMPPPYLTEEEGSQQSMHSGTPANVEYVHDSDMDNELDSASFLNTVSQDGCDPISEAHEPLPPKDPE